MKPFSMLANAKFHGILVNSPFFLTHRLKLRYLKIDTRRQQKDILFWNIFLTIFSSRLDAVKSERGQFGSRSLSRNIDILINRYFSLCSNDQIRYNSKARNPYQ